MIGLGWTLLGKCREGLFRVGAPQEVARGVGTEYRLRDEIKVVLYASACQAVAISLRTIQNPGPNSSPKKIEKQKANSITTKEPTLGPKRRRLSRIITQHCIISSHSRGGERICRQTHLEH